MQYTQVVRFKFTLSLLDALYTTQLHNATTSFIHIASVARFLQSHRTETSKSLGTSKTYPQSSSVLGTIAQGQRQMGQNGVIVKKSYCLDGNRRRIIIDILEMRVAFNMHRPRSLVSLTRIQSASMPRKCCTRYVGLVDITPSWEMQNPTQNKYTINCSILFR
jgi:hypothetical protein